MIHSDIVVAPSPPQDPVVSSTVSAQTLPFRRDGVRRAVGAVAVAGLAAHAIYAVGDLDVLDRVVGDGFYNALILIAAVACLCRGLWGEGERLAWLVMAGGLFCWSAAEIFKSATGGRDDTDLSIADPLYLAFYPAAYAALILLVRERMTRLPAGIWLDGIIAALATAALGATVFERSINDATDADGVAIAVNLAYPLADVVLLGMVVGVIALTGWRPERAWVLLAASLTVGAVADGIFLDQVARDTYEAGTLLDTLWPLSVLLIGFAAWAPTKGRVALQLGGWRLVVAPCLFSLVAVAIVAESLVQAPSRPALGLAVTCLVATIGRMALAHRDTLRAVGGLREASLTDSLTGLLNRRALMLRLEEPRDEPMLLAILDLDGFKGFNDRFGHVRGDALLEELAHRLRDTVGRDRAFRLGGDEFCVLVPGATTLDAAVLEAASEALTTEVDDVAISASLGAMIAEVGDRDVSGILHVADQRMYAQKQAQRMSNAFAGLLDALYRRVPALRTRNSEVSRVARAMGAAAGMDERDLFHLERAVELRDLGLIAVPGNLLTQPAPLLTGDQMIVDQHSETAAQMILGATPQLEEVARTVRHCGERYDGSGRPHGLAGESIPLASRIIAAADAYVRATEPGGAGTAQALEALRFMSGRALDPAVVDVLENALSSTAISR